MKNILLFLFLFLIFSTSKIFAQCVIEEPKLTEFGGTVAQADKQVISGAEVKVYKNKSYPEISIQKPLKEIKTDTSGHFEIKTLAQGQYLVAISAQNYVTLRFTVRISKENGSNDHELNVILGADLNDDSCGGGSVSVAPAE